MDDRRELALKLDVLLRRARSSSDALAARRVGGGGLRDRRCSRISGPSRSALGPNGKAVMSGERGGTPGCAGESLSEGNEIGE